MIIRGIRVKNEAGALYRTISGLNDGEFIVHLVCPDGNSEIAAQIIDLRKRPSNPGMK